MLWSAAPEDLVRAVRAQGVHDERVLAAFGEVPRARFVPAAHRAQAYEDRPLPIGHGQVTTQPSLSAAMIEALRLTGDERVLEVGTGYGFQTALLARLSARVVSVDLWPEMVERVRTRLEGLGVTNVVPRVGDGTLGAPDEAPFDAVLVSAAHPRVPPPLVEQLATGGRLVQPIGTGGDEDVVLFVRTERGLERRASVIRARFVRLHGEHGYPLPEGWADA
ncbi:protein-L-isoaspartate(D-aspartate) O-methyltransferase [Nocardiopsis sp. EMB25]|uniref:protein-L-isoaspartate(D-aspartate) O-methyltransferase n=1 Tax=Nocardiopsis TaxID=2013 RepID=UPI000347770F|nr:MULTISPECIES: protein-L-isoaspartate(D-aspartate) O-methyltransferase [Nocardiopsis]MCY9783488.1 protein-L-isoaspartate(D-aspartate) O-methyltransferase [Nocardiopsis sp. EMB25]